MIEDPRPKFRWSDTIIEAFTAIAQRPWRAALTGLGTILGVAAFVATSGLADTARAQVSARFDALKATEVRIQDAQPDGTDPFPDDVDRRLEALNGITSAGLSYPVDVTTELSPRNTATRPLGTVTPIPVIATTPGALRAALPTVTTGRLLDAFHEQRAERVAVIGRVAAEQLGITRVDNQPAIFIGETAYTVIGIIDDVKRYPDLLLSVIIPTSTERARIGTDGPIYEVLIATTPGAAPLAGRQAPLALRPQDPERLQALVPPDPETLRNDVDSDITSLYYALAALALLIGTVAIANATLLNAMERTPEIGLRRALGATKWHIVKHITVEAAAIGTAAAVIGTTIAIYAISIYSFQRGWTTTISPLIPLVAPLIGLVTGTIAGIPPAIKAARTPPAITLKA